MAYPKNRILDAELAGDFARKFFGKFGFAKVETFQPKRSPAYKNYQVGVVSPDGDFVLKGESGYDFAEAFQLAGKFMDDRDPLFLRSEVKQLAQAETPKPKQVEMFAL